MAERGSWGDRLREFLRGLSLTANLAAVGSDRVAVDN